MFRFIFIIKKYYYFCRDQTTYLSLSGLKVPVIYLFADISSNSLYISNITCNSKKIKSPLFFDNAYRIAFASQ